MIAHLRACPICWGLITVGVILLGLIAVGWASAETPLRLTWCGTNPSRCDIRATDRLPQTLNCNLPELLAASREWYDVIHDRGVYARARNADRLHMRQATSERWGLAVRACGP